jgi:hypothetical protein
VIDNERKEEIKLFISTVKKGHLFFLEKNIPNIWSVQKKALTLQTIFNTEK